MYTSPQRKATRARGFDYRAPGPYFVTIAEFRRQNRFGTVADAGMHLNAEGQMVWNTWSELCTRYPGVMLDAFVIMPNHVHGLVTLDHPVGAGLDGNPSLTDVMGWFKSVTTTRYGQGVRDSDWPPFDQHLWQRSFHDRIVRDDAEMDRIRTYIANNPALWIEDTFFEP